MTEIRDLNIDEIKTDVDEIQTRLGLLDEERVQILCEKYQEKGTEAFPLPVVFHDEDGVYWLASGHYRVAAIRKALSSDPDAPRVVRVEECEGSKRDAAFFAASANSEHGTQLTWEEMRRLVIRLLRDPQWAEIGDREIARLIGASPTYVNKIHHELDDQDASVNGLQMPPKRKVKTKRGGKPFNTTVDNTRRGRDPKAKTTTTTIQPVSPAVPQEEPIPVQDVEHTSNETHKNVITDGSEAQAAPDTVEDEEHTTQDNQEDIEAVINDAADGLNDRHESEMHQEAVTTEDFENQAAQNERSTTEDDERPTNDDQESDTSTTINTLKDAWKQANSAERMSFLQWIIVHETDKEIQNKVTAAINVQLHQSNEEMP